MTPDYIFQIAKKTWQTVLFALIYLGGVTATLLQALAENPLLEALGKL